MPNKSNAGFLTSILMMAAMEGSLAKTNLKAFKPIFSADKPDAPTPKGCKDYWFDKEGTYSNERGDRFKAVFHCVALNEASAQKKFNKFKQTAQNEKANCR